MMHPENNLLEGFTVAKRRNRYREMEYYMTRILLGDVAVFALYLLFANLGWGFLKGFTAIVAILASVLCGGFLYINGEWKKKRSQWMFLGFAGILLCMIFSLIFKVPFGPVA